MIRVDDRQGSRDFARPLEQCGASVRLTRLEFGDLAFRGNGPQGSVRIGIERKTSDELVNTITDSRFAGYQVPGLLRTYSYVYLLLDGMWKPDPRSGILLTYRRGEWVSAGHTRRRLMYAEFVNYLTSLEMLASVRVIRVASFTEAVHAIHALYTWWRKDWDAHKSHRQVYETKPDTAILERQTLLRRIAAQIPDIGWVRSRAVEQQCASVKAMVAMSRQEWAELKTGKNDARLGTIRASRIVAQLRGTAPETPRKRSSLARRSF